MAGIWAKPPRKGQILLVQFYIYIFLLFNMRLFYSAYSNPAAFSGATPDDLRETRAESSRCDFLYAASDEMALPRGRV